jgi:hypothetical protein
MLTEDFGRFEVAIRKLEFTYSKAVPDEMMQAFWVALKDLPFEQVQERINAHVRYNKFFPRPVELRPKEDRPRDKGAAEDGAFKAAEAASIRHLEELRKVDPKAWIVELAKRNLGRLLVEHTEDSEVYRERRQLWAAKYAEVCAGRHTS